MDTNRTKTIWKNFVVTIVAVKQSSAQIKQEPKQQPPSNVGALVVQRTSVAFLVGQKAHFSFLRSTVRAPGHPSRKE